MPKRAVLLVNHSLIEHVLKAGFSGEYTSDAPDDVKVVGVDPDRCTPHLVALVLESASFPASYPEGGLPFVDVVFKRKANG